MSLLLLLSGTAAATLTCSGGSVSLVGNEVTFRIGRRISADVQNYNEDLKPANLAYGRKQVSGGSVYRTKTEVNGPALFTDTITQANGTILGDTAEWDRWNTTTVDTINSNGTNAVSTTANRTSVGVIVANTTFGPDQWAEHTHQATSAGRWTAGPLVRASGGTSTNGYSFLNAEGNGFTNPSAFRIVKHVSNGNPTTIATSGPEGFGPVANSGTYTMRLEVIGDRLYGYIDGKLIVTGIDSTFTSGQPGFQIIYGGSTISFSAGQIEASTTGLNASRTLSCATATYNEDLKPANLLIGRKLVAKVYADEQLFSDDFTGTNGVLGAEYTQQGDVPLRRDGLGNANAVGAGRGLAWPNTVSFADSHYAEITIVAIETTSNNSGIGLRIQNSASPAVEYGYIFRTGNAGAAYTFAQYNASSTNVNIITTNIIPQVGDRLRAVVVGNNQYFYVNDQLIAVGSTTSWSGGVPAIYGNGTIWKSDNFVAGNYGGLHLHGTYTNTRVARVLVCASASYTLELKDTNLLAGRNLTSDTQNYTLSLKDATLTKTTTARTITADTQSYSLGGGQANLIVSRKLTSDTRTYAFDPQSANLFVGRKLTSDTRTYAFDPQPANLKTTRTLSATVQSYTLSLKDASLKVGKKLTSDVGSYSLSLNDAAIKVGRKVTADKQTYTFNGNNANLKASRTLLSATQNYTLSLKDAALKSDRKLAATTQSYTLSGVPVGLKIARKLSATLQSYSVNGNNLNILVGRKLSATSQSYTLNGTQAGLIIGRRLSATGQSYTINPIAANLKRTFRLPATQQSYALSGIPVGLSKIGAVILAATSSSISISSSQVGLLVSRRISLSAGQYNIAGNSVETLRGIRLIAASSTYTLNTVPANLNRGRRLSLSAGAITLNTSVLNILRGRRLVATQQTYTFNGNSAGLLATRRISLSVYSASINTNPTNLPLGRRLIAAQQTYNLSLNAAGVKYGRRLGLAQQIYSLNYSELIFTRGGFIKVWNGSAWVSKPLKVWNGTAWVSKSLKVWTGTIWRTY